MKFNIKHILSGIKNTLFVKEEVEKISMYRMDHCRKCPFNSKNSPQTLVRPDEHCTKCGCNLAFKTRSLDSECPIGKWGAEASEEEANLIDKAINKDEDLQS